MNLIFDAERLTRLTDGLSTLSGLCVRALRDDGMELCASGRPAGFCARLHECPEGRARCRACCAELPMEGALRRCHAGLCTMILPIRAGEYAAPIAWLCAGPFLDGAPQERWDAALAGLTDDSDALRWSFFALRRLSAAEQAALREMLAAMADRAQLRGWLRTSEENNLQRLERYLDEHYMEKLTLASVSAQLHIGRTRLCALARELSGGETLFAMISRRRIRAAQALLAQSDAPISAVAEAVGISDYNYFSRIFRRATGMSPSAYRRQARRAD